MRVQSVTQIRVQTAQTAMRTQTIMILMQQQHPGQAMALARILMMTLAFLTLAALARQVVLLARLELVVAGVEGMGKGKGGRVHRLVHVLQPLPLLRLQSKSKVHRG